jgi:hypothetical protein
LVVAPVSESRVCADEADFAGVRGAVFFAGCRLGVGLGASVSPGRAGLIFATGGEVGGRATVDRSSGRPETLLCAAPPR